MIAYHGDPAIKQKYQARLAEHRRLEHLTQRVGYETHTGQPKGCAVGCTLENYDHSLYPVELGLPEWLARLEDSIFEGLPKLEAEQFAEDFLAAIRPGADVSDVWRLLAIARHTRSLAQLPVEGPEYLTQVRSAIQGVIDWLNEGALESARSAARSAAESAESAWSARSAAESAWSARSAARSAAESARSAAESAWSARSAARSAAESAAESARSAAFEDYWKWEAATLLSLLSAC